MAGYADSEGKREQDLSRPHAWRYRDYVIRSLAADKPYDRFLVEQLAGDELADYEHAAEITPEIYDNLVATGFLRMASDATWANITGYVADRLEVIADEIDVLGSAVLGLTMKCARCHSHKFDPIPQRDYYRLTAVFKGAFDEHDWLKPDVRPGVGPLSQDVLPGRQLPYVTTAERRAWEENDERIERGIAELKQTLEEKTQSLAAKLLDERLAQLPEALRADLRTMLATAPEKRDAVQTYLAEKFEAQLRVDQAALRAADAAFKSECEEIERQIKALEAQQTPEPRVHALWDRGEPSPTYIYRRGESASPGRLVGPGVPSVLTDGRTPFDAQPPWPGAKKTGRRLALARWLVEPEHPLTARVMVNRIWKHHFGAGIVKSLGNFGRVGTPPTHPELARLAGREFVERGWSIKSMHRLMMASATYRQSSAVTPATRRSIRRMSGCRGCLSHGSMPSNFTTRCWPRPAGWIYYCCFVVSIGASWILIPIAFLPHTNAKMYAISPAILSTDRAKSDFCCFRNPPFAISEDGFLVAVEVRPLPFVQCFSFRIVRMTP